MGGNRRAGRALPMHLQSAMDTGELEIYRNFLAGQDKERLRELYTVVLVNSDLADKLRVEPILFSHSGFSDIGHFGSGAGLLAVPCIPSN